MSDEKDNVTNLTMEDPIITLFREASEEVQEEALKAAKKKIKERLKQKQSAERILANINREIKELQLEIKNDLGL